MLVLILAIAVLVIFILLLFSMFKIASMADKRHEKIVEEIIKERRG